MPTPKKPGRPVANTARRAVYLSPEADQVFMDVTKSQRSKLVSKLILDWAKKNKRNIG